MSKFWTRNEVECASPEKSIYTTRFRNLFSIKIVQSLTDSKRFINVEHFDKKNHVGWHLSLNYILAASLYNQVFCLVGGNCGKTADWIWMPFGSECRSMDGVEIIEGKGQFQGKCGASIVTNGYFVM